MSRLNQASPLLRLMFCGGDSADVICWWGETTGSRGGGSWGLELRLELWKACLCMYSLFLVENRVELIVF